MLHNPSARGKGRHTGEGAAPLTQGYRVARARVVNLGASREEEGGRERERERTPSVAMFTTFQGGPFVEVFSPQVSHAGNGESV